jgi:hypothetical protein
LEIPASLQRLDEDVLHQILDLSPPGVIREKAMNIRAVGQKPLLDCGIVDDGPLPSCLRFTPILDARGAISLQIDWTHINGTVP